MFLQDFRFAGMEVTYDDAKQARTYRSSLISFPSVCNRKSTSLDKRLSTNIEAVKMDRDPDLKPPARQNSVQRSPPAPYFCLMHLYPD